MREARSIPIIKQLLKDGAEVIAYDPIANPAAQTIFKNSIKYASSATKCLRETDCCILVTEWNEFRRLTPQDFKKNMRKPNLVDGRRIYDPMKFSRELEFAAIGLAPE
jgi:UDPglucose 6-dehydrogenase